MIERIGNYRITDEIGSGGMAVVYKGVQESLKRAVAIKALKTSVSDDRDVVARFEREATSIASLQHENVITVYDFFRERGALFIVMEYVEGIDLYDLLERCGRLPADVAAIISLQVARALDHAHFCGVIHRDVKPANVIISKLGLVKLTDFGIARIEESDLTAYGVGLGTPAYMSPEQILGGHLDHRSDIFSLGIVMYQMLTGQKPFVEDAQRTAMDKIREDTPKRPRALNPSVPGALERIILRCMQKSVDERYGSTQELVIALEQVLAATVNQNYRVRLLMYLKEQGLLSHEEATATLHPALVGEYMGRVPLLRLRRRLRWPLLAALLLLVGAPTAALLYAGKLILATPSHTPSRPCPAVPPPETGYLRVLAHPWARVEVDGKIEVTTPVDRPLELRPGRHRVVLTNPYFETVEREIELSAGKLATISEVLRRVTPLADGAVGDGGAPRGRADGAPGGGDR